jgi:hypothetical protein
MWIISDLLLFIGDVYRIESGLYSNQPADFLLFALFGWIVLWGYASLFPWEFLGTGFAAYVMYYRAKRFPDEMFMLDALLVPGSWIPFLFFVWAVPSKFKGEDLRLVGYAAAHAFFVLHDVLFVKYSLGIFRLPTGVNAALTRLIP